MGTKPDFLSYSNLRKETFQEKPTFFPKKPPRKYITIIILLTIIIIFFLKSRNQSNSSIKSDNQIAAPMGS